MRKNTSKMMIQVTVQKDGTMTSPSDSTAPQCPPSPGDRPDKLLVIKVVIMVVTTGVDLWLWCWSSWQPHSQTGRAITKTSSEERDRGLNLEASLNNQRPASLDLAARQRPPHFSAPGAAPPSHTNPLIYLQNNNMAGHINPAMLNQVS